MHSISMKRRVKVLLAFFLSVIVSTLGACNGGGGGSTSSSPATPTITWPAPAAITYGTALSSTQLNATANYPGTFAYSPVAGTVLGAGSHSLSVLFTPSDPSKVLSGTATNSITVNKATPAITWNTPAAVSVGTALSATQLDATASFGGSSVPGAFAYTPASGTVMNTAGSQTLSVAFTPTDTTDYNSATASVSLNVTAVVGVTSITVTPNAAVIGTQQQFTATVQGTGTFSQNVTWSVACTSCAGLSAGIISQTGLYNTPFPAPATVTVTATSKDNTSISGSVSVALNPPATVAGPALTVDAADKTHAISPDIYGMNAFAYNETVEKAMNLPVDRWGGEGVTRYNYVADVSNTASDWYFENHVQGGGTQDAGKFNQEVESDERVGAKTLGTVPVMGWVSKNGTACSFPTSTYPNQTGQDPYNASCGNGVYPQGVGGCTQSGGCNITGNDATLTSQAVDATWTGGWVNYLVSKFGNAANGGVAIYSLDNEPDWWSAVHRDVHPNPFTYDEVTVNGIATAKAVKSADPTAAVSGPVAAGWTGYFTSMSDVQLGWETGPCYQWWSNQADRKAHGGIPLLEYYLQQMNSASTAYGARLLDYLDMHTYFAATYQGSATGVDASSDTQGQITLVDSTRAFWDPTYTNPNYTQPNYPTDSNYTTSCNVPLQAPQLIPMAQKWIADDYPGTKLAFTEYNWGDLGTLNGALAQADVLGIFGKYGLDLATLWGQPAPASPGLMAFEIYRNYDGKNSMFGDTALQSVSADQGKLSVYGAVRSSDGALTIVVINKTYGTLTSTLALENFTSSSATAQVYQYSNANLANIVPLAPAAVVPPSGSGTTSTIAGTFPAQSITLVVVPK